MGMGARYWRSIALGAALTILGLPLPASGASSADVESVDFLTPSLGYALVGRGPTAATPRVYRTGDGGGHWLAVGGGLPAGQYPHPGNDIAFASQVAGIALLSRGAAACQAAWAVYRTADGGRFWQAKGGFSGQDGPLAVAWPPQGVPWILNGSCAGGYATLYRSSGQEWVRVRQFTLPQADAKAFLSPSAVSLQRHGTRQAFLAVAYYQVQSTQRSLILGYRTTDGGATWHPVSVGNRGLEGTVGAIAFYTASEGLSVVRTRTGGALYVTRDGGAHWQPVAGVPVPGSVYAASIQWVNANVADVLLGQDLWRTPDGGATWHVSTRNWPL